jgi:hypothetical protein
MKVIVRFSPILKVHAPDLDDAVTLRGFKTGGFSVKHNLSHGINA